MKMVLEKKRRRRIFCLLRISSSEAKRCIPSWDEWSEERENGKTGFAKEIHGTLKEKSWSGGEKKSKVRENGILLPQQLEQKRHGWKCFLPFISTASTNPRRRRSTAGRHLCAIWGRKKSYFGNSGEERRSFDLCFKNTSSAFPIFKVWRKKSLTF